MVGYKNEMELLSPPCASDWGYLFMGQGAWMGASDRIFLGLGVLNRGVLSYHLHVNVYTHVLVVSTQQRQRGSKNYGRPGMIEALQEENGCMLRAQGGYFEAGYPP